ncbi:hypothetical protein CCACVL1_18453 [Corchorus capsularis]|uniref:Uncharacterized protein n=1 Tax=Corchorus capsularis TaxID=210143 RepID=A0A1R3HL91_COCAP|nr:hypothetical protein CCACVL1_18453 [Corchorus capsularis]
MNVEAYGPAATSAGSKPNGSNPTSLGD